jgi:short subunit dehydrogenase-like uncharacterized protein
MEEARVVIVGATGMVGGISSEDLARTMAAAGLYGTAGHEDPVLENRDIRALAR